MSTRDGVSPDTAASGGRPCQMKEGGEGVEKERRERERE